MLLQVSESAITSAREAASLVGALASPNHSASSSPQGPQTSARLMFLAQELKQAALEAERGQAAKLLLHRSPVVMRR